MLELEHLVTTHFPDSSALIKAVRERNFNFLLRQAASNSKNNILLEFLLANTSNLKIDIFAEGEKSGNALDVAKKFNNPGAVKMLNAHGLHKGKFESS